MEKKYNNKIVFLINIVSFLLNFQITLGQGFIANENYRETIEQAVNTTGQSSNQNSSTLDCSQCPNNQSNNSSLYIPAFTVQILDKSQKILNLQSTPNNPPGKVLSINNSSSAMLIVQIFPASNNIPSSSVSFIGEKNHLIMYTLKDLLTGTATINYDLIPSSAGIPNSINIPSVSNITSQANSNSSQAGILPMSNGSQSAAYISLFGTNNTNLTDTAVMTILNGLSPLTQKFIINSSDNQNFSITSISGSTDSQVSQVSTISGVTSLTGLNISFDNTQLITFTGNTISFDSDLQKGVILDVIIYPQNSNNSYQVVASLRSGNGSKYRKEYALTSNDSINPLSSLPSTITISGPSIQNSSTRNFFNTNTANNNPNFFNFIAPISLQFRISS